MGVRVPSSTTATPTMRLPSRSANSVALDICAAKHEGNIMRGMLLEIAASTSRWKEAKVESATSATSQATNWEPPWASQKSVRVSRTRGTTVGGCPTQPSPGRRR